MKNIYPYAGFWKRFAAALLDSLVLGAASQVINPLLALFGIAPTQPAQTQMQISPEMWAYIFCTMAIGFVISVLYFSLMESSSWQATLGKMALQIKVVDYNGQRISFWHAVGRRMAKILSGTLTVNIGYLMAGATRKKQALHDKIAHTYVVVKDFQPGAELPEVEPRWGVFWSVTGILALFWVLLVMSFVAIFAVASRAIQASQQTQVQQQGATPTPVFPGDVPNPMNGN